MWPDRVSNPGPLTYELSLSEVKGYTIMGGKYVSLILRNLFNGITS